MQAGLPFHSRKGYAMSRGVCNFLLVVWSSKRRWHLVLMRSTVYGYVEQIAGSVDVSIPHSRRILAFDYRVQRQTIMLHFF
jgi:hypothetical protein